MPPPDDQRTQELPGFAAPTRRPLTTVGLSVAGPDDPSPGLRRRLRATAAIYVFTFLQVLTVVLLPGLRVGEPSVEGRAGPLDRNGIAVLAAAFFGCTAVLLLLGRSAQLTARTLRRVELGLLVIVAAFLAYWHFDLLTYRPYRDPAVPRNYAFTHVLFAQFHGLLTWFVLTVIAGLFLPDEPWRTRVKVGLLWALVLAVVGLALTLTPDLREHWPFLGVTSLLLPGTAVALTLVAAADADSLRRAVAAAREEAEQLRQYRLTRKLGEGGMGEVWLGEHRLLKRPCAVKLLRPEGSVGEAAATRFEREVRATAALAHPNVVEVYDYGRTDGGRFYYVMEYLDGIGLDELVARHGPPPPGRAVYLLRQLCRALREAHRAGLVHRDVKPSNAIVCRAPGRWDVVKLLDFGLVRGPVAGGEAMRLTQEGLVVGTPEYLAPEQAIGGTVDARGDLYALGGVGYFLLTGRPPFVRDNAVQLLLAHAHEPPQPPRSLRREVPVDLEAVILRCLAKKPEDRPADAAEVERALAACACAADWDETRAAWWWEAVAVTPVKTTG
jgi:hypothetical protein